jgi:hypothetical protein
MLLYLAIGGFLVVILFAGVMGALAIWARRLGSLISLHHHLAGGTNNKDDPKRGALRKSRRRISPERRNRLRDI